MRFAIYSAILMLLATAAFAVSAWLMPDRPGVTRSNFDCIQDGMTLAEVSVLLGEPSDVSPSGICWGELRNGRVPANHVKHVFAGDRGGAYVMFDEHGGARYRGWQDAPPESLWERLRRWLRLP